MITICSADVVYHKPIDVYDYGYPAPPFYYGPLKYYDAALKKKSFTDELKEYFKIFVETFSKSYKEINAPYVVERPVPVAVPG